ncbi:hypothetical protein JTB14_031965 [Gonioctena quinquepunctata]|nr:hypothetical protein JTB14_031965 [Gonioctena quinquepunctata]
MKWNKNTADWSQFQTLLDDSILKHKNASESPSLEDCMNTIDDIASTAMEIKQLSISSTPHPPWWDLEYSSMVVKRRDASMKYKQTSNWENYKKPKPNLFSKQKLKQVGKSSQVI